MIKYPPNKPPHKIEASSQTSDQNTLSSADLAIAAAKLLIQKLQANKSLTETQYFLLASAHHTLAKQEDLSFTRHKIHLNSAIALFQKMKKRDFNQDLELAKAYFKRAENKESEHHFISASIDYQKNIELLEKQDPNILEEPSILLIAQSAISIADILVNERVAAPQLPESQPLYYVNKALEYLAKLTQESNALWTTLAYAHQVAAHALSDTDLDAATEAFRTSLLMAFKADPKSACPILADIYNSMGLLYLHYDEITPSAKFAMNFKEHANIYFCLSLFFNAHEPSDPEEIYDFLDSIFDMMYRHLDPYLPALPLSLITDFIDALIFGFYCVSNGSLPNPLLCQRLQQSDLSNTYAQHIYWLIVDLYRRENKNGRILDLCDPNKVDIKINAQELLQSLSNKNTNISYFPKKIAAVT